jgi:hypothetical protein
MTSSGLTNPVLRIRKSDDCVSLGIDHPGARCTPCKYKHDQLSVVMQEEEEEEKFTNIQMRMGGK